MTIFKRKLLAEIFYLTLTFLLTLLLYKIWPTFVLFNVPDFYYSSTNSLNAIAFGQLWCVLLFFTNSIRQISSRFRNKATSVFLLMICLVLLVYSIQWHRFISDVNSAFLEDGGLVRYPPLSTLGVDEFNQRAKDLASRIIWASDIIVALITTTSLIFTIYKRKDIKNES